MSEDRALLEQYQNILDTAKDHQTRAQIWDEALKDFWKIARFAEIEKMTFSAAINAIYVKRYEEQARYKSNVDYAETIKQRIDAKSPVQPPEG